MALSTLTRLALAAAFVFAGLTARADFGELDIMVEDSILADFASRSLDVDLPSMEYDGDYEMDGNVMVFKTSIFGEAKKGETVLYRCVTRLQINAPGKYVDQGSVCEADRD